MEDQINQSHQEKSQEPNLMDQELMESAIRMEDQMLYLMALDQQ
jgi:hypothetical protein